MNAGLATCAFCGKGEPVVVLVQGPAVLICNECVDLARADLARRGVAPTSSLEEFPHRCVWACCAECHPLPPTGPRVLRRSHTATRR